MRKIPDNNLSYPVLVQAGPSSGSGFFLNASSQLCLVTANHVLHNVAANALHHPSARLTSQAKDPTETQPVIFDLDLATLATEGNIRTDPSHDICIVRIGEVIPQEQGYLTNLLHGVNLVASPPSGLVSASGDNLRQFSDVMVGNEIYVFGYPVSLGLPTLPQIDFTKPLLRSGIIAGKNASRRAIVLDCPVYPGNSGGPVLEIEQDGFAYRYRIAGVVVEFVPVLSQVVAGPGAGSHAVVNSGYALASAMDDVIALVAQFDAAS